jgi:hypothetical protein
MLVPAPVGARLPASIMDMAGDHRSARRLAAAVPAAVAGAADWSEQDGGALITAQRIGSAIGIAVVGTALFGSGSGHSDSAKLMPSLTHAARSVIVLNLAFVLAAWLCAFGLPKTLAAERAEDT